MTHRSNRARPALLSSMFLVALLHAGSACAVPEPDGRTLEAKPPVQVRPGKKMLVVPPPPRVNPVPMGDCSKGQCGSNGTHPNATGSVAYDGNRMPPTTRIKPSLPPIQQRQCETNCQPGTQKCISTCDPMRSNGAPAPVRR